MTTPVPDVREIAARAMHALGGCKCGDVASEWDWRAADAVLAAVEPVIRRQVAEEIARDLEAAHGSLSWLTMRHEAAAIARSHSTREEQDHG